MSTHLHDRDGAKGRFGACGRYVENGEKVRGVAFTKSVRDVSCQSCMRTDAFLKARARVPRALDWPKNLPWPGRCD